MWFLVVLGAGCAPKHEATDRVARADQTEGGRLYVTSIRGLVNPYWKQCVNALPHSAYPNEREYITILTALLGPEGSLGELTIAASSGVSDLDLCAFDAFRGAAPFPPPAAVLGSAAALGLGEMRFTVHRVTSTQQGQSGPTMVVELPDHLAEVFGVGAVSVPILNYPVLGKTWSEISSGWSERPSPGLTRNRVTCDRRAWSDPNGCYLENIDLRWAIEVELPQWDKPPDADSGFAARWDRSLARLRDHEEGHVRINLEGLAQLHRALRTAECETLSSELNLWLGRVESWNDAYDECTDHGRAPATCKLEDILDHIRAGRDAG
jgi:hypothetical protein